MSRIITRRRFLIGATMTASALGLAGCDALVENDRTKSVLKIAEGFSMKTQRFLLGDDALAREFTEVDISPTFRANGTSMPDNARYIDWMNQWFSSWKLEVGGLVDKPMQLSLPELKALPARTQITRHDCVEGWSAIGKWTGVPLGALLQTAGLKPEARYIVFHCADEYEKTLDGSGWYYESIDLLDAFHPQTILAHSMNGRDLEVAHGAPLRLRVERQLGYKQAKYLTGIDAVADLGQFFGGNGGFWEDRGYEWYAGI
ncbi:molybdopterin-dependent oxidoreductase [Rhizobium laguerreae]|uniref:molybdopterin-dependent oxidoreductase n=1 Tax=Rhizobium laguerreae TaxID=1076926 RepID=UPI001C90F8F5|nr:molybdopterin-dependent oxidoreductase [Rhizobium laguerreae]MBY3215089.1 molybdopterin-dependent oxidoreductase [Rhizobium laguerreae]MBY3329412.1 molybdopterin-dependent oxidoreductase [Rhizobium laguerreae]MBY3441363.1 molybdopterin-dependent oxidoreductase [Rhizobium laguerreae]